MGINKTYVDNAVFIRNLHHQSVFIAVGLENHAIPSNNSGSVVPGFNFGRTVPIFFPNFMIPTVKTLFGVRITLPELP